MHHCHLFLDISIALGSNTKIATASLLLFPRTAEKTTPFTVFHIVLFLPHREEPNIATQADFDWELFARKDA